MPLSPEQLPNPTIYITLPQNPPQRVNTRWGNYVHTKAMKFSSYFTFINSPCQKKPKQQNKLRQTTQPYQNQYSHTHLELEQG